MTEVEPEFDATERQGWTLLEDYEAELCPSCGNLRSVCSDPNVGFYPQRTTCYATAVRDQVIRRMSHHYEKAKPTEKNGWALPDDGTSYWVSAFDLTPDDTFDGAFPKVDPAD